MRSFIGYSPKQVEKELEKNAEEFRRTSARLEAQLCELDKKNAWLRSEIGKLDGRDCALGIKKAQLETLLFDAHLESCKKICDEERRFDDMVKSCIDKTLPRLSSDAG